MDPRAVVSLGAHLLAARLFRRRRPLLAGFKITDRCNCRCVACPFWRTGVGDIPFGTAVDALDRLRAAGVKLVILEGGEPFLWQSDGRRLAELVSEARRRFLRVGVTTNGTFPLCSEADVLWVSLDGLQPTHDRLRGVGTFEQALGHIEASDHPRLFANITINRANVDEIPDLVRFLAVRVRGITIQFNYPYPGTEELWLDRDRRRTVLDRLVELKRRGYPLLDSVATLRHLKDNTWRCHPWLVANVEADGRMNRGCYLLERAEVACNDCGFAAHVELSLAYDLHPASILAAMRVFGL